MIVVTGASRGLGKAITERLTRNGEQVIGLSRSIDNLNIQSIECDVSDYMLVKKGSSRNKK